MEAIILAGGLGTRLASRLKGIPKPMAPVAGRPFLEILMAELAQQGCGRVILSVGHLHDVIENHFGESFRGMKIDYITETVPLGTGGAIRLALERASHESLLVLNGDTFLKVNYQEMLEFHASRGTPLTLAVTPRADTLRYGSIVLDEERIVGFREKELSGPGWINAGVYAISRGIEWPTSVGKSFSFERDFLIDSLQRIAPAAYRVEGFFLDIGIPEDLDRAQTELAKIVM
jgi:D-glycero-alpha-D-manno-heptose 1-phosphate guanylyltransferase